MVLPAHWNLRRCGAYSDFRRPIGERYAHITCTEDRALATQTHDHAANARNKKTLPGNGGPGRGLIKSIGSWRMRRSELQFIGDDVAVVDRISPLQGLLPST